MHILDLLHTIVAEGWGTLELIHSKGDLINKTEEALLLLRTWVWEWTKLWWIRVFWIHSCLRVKFRHLRRITQRIGAVLISNYLLHCVLKCFGICSLSVSILVVWRTLARVRGVRHLLTMWLIVLTSTSVSIPILLLRLVAVISVHSFALLRSMLLLAGEGALLLWFNNCFLFFLTVSKFVIFNLFD